MHSQASQSLPKPECAFYQDHPFPFPHVSYAHNVWEATILQNNWPGFFKNISVKKDKKKKIKAKGLFWIKEKFTVTLKPNRIIFNRFLDLKKQTK